MNQNHISLFQNPNPGTMFLPRFENTTHPNTSTSSSSSPHPTNLPIDNRNNPFNFSLESYSQENNTFHSMSSNRAMGGSNGQMEIEDTENYQFNNSSPQEPFMQEEEQREEDSERTRDVSQYSADKHSPFLGKKENYEEFESEAGKPSIETRSQSEDEIAQHESFDNSPSFVHHDISIVLPVDDFDKHEEMGYDKRKPFRIIRKGEEEEKLAKRGRGRPKRKHSIILSPREEIEIEKPYVFPLHSAVKDNRIEKTPIGRAHQAAVLPFALNRGQKPIRSPVKLTWRPDFIDQETWENYLKTISEIVGENITNEEAAVKHLRKWNWDIEKAVTEVRKHKMAFRSHFRVCQMFLRNRAGLLPMQKAF